MSADAELRAVNVIAANGRMNFTAVNGSDHSVLDVELNLAGTHNVLNALSAIAIAREIGISDAHIAQALGSFTGVGRRFQRYGEIAIGSGGTFTLIDDYGHHPVEMAAVLAAARGAFPGKRIVLAFQPHRYTRTRDLFEDFVKVMSTADELILADVYPAGEAPIVAADGRALARAVRVAGKVEPLFVETAGEIPDAVLSRVRDGDVVITMGAGSVGGVAPALAGTGGGE
jgi:UDP-N-acetylmuramate--alanine ligase